MLKIFYLLIVAAAIASAAPEHNRDIEENGQERSSGTGSGTGSSSGYGSGSGGVKGIFDNILQKFKHGGTGSVSTSSTPGSGWGTGIGSGYGHGLGSGYGTGSGAGWNIGYGSGPGIGYGKGKPIVINLGGKGGKYGGYNGGLGWKLPFHKRPYINNPIHNGNMFQNAKIKRRIIRRRGSPVKKGYGNGHKMGGKMGNKKGYGGMGYNGNIIGMKG